MKGASSTTSLASSQGATAQKIKLVCLHGYLQNAELFSSKIGSMRKGLKSRCQFTFVDGPYEVSTDDSEITAQSGGQREGGRCWWRWAASGQMVSRPSRSIEYLGLRTSLEAVVGAMEAERADGLLGFSMGGTTVAVALAALHLLARGQVAEVVPAMRAWDGTGETDESNLKYLSDLSDKLRAGTVLLPKFGIVIGGFGPYDPMVQGLLKAGGGGAQMLFVSGEQDPLVPWERTQELSQYFPQAAYYRHPGGHLVPTCSGEFKARMVEFLEGATAPAAAGAGEVAEVGDQTGTRLREGVAAS